MLVLFLVVTVFVLPPFMTGEAPLLNLLFDVSFSLMLLTGLTVGIYTPVTVDVKGTVGELK